MGLVGEITETVGGLNRNAWALSPKYAGDLADEFSFHLGDETSLSVRRW